MAANRGDDDVLSRGKSPASPVASGKTERVHFRLACPKFLRQTFHEFATQSIRRSEWTRAYYEHLRGDEMKSHHAAVRALAYKWIRIIFRCWKVELRQKLKVCRPAPVATTAQPRLLYLSALVLRSSV
jgi:hypothetical protein